MPVYPSIIKRATLLCQNHKSMPTEAMVLALSVIAKPGVTQKELTELVEFIKARMLVDEADSYQGPIDFNRED